MFLPLYSLIMCPDGEEMKKMTASHGGDAEAGRCHVILCV